MQNEINADIAIGFTDTKKYNAKATQKLYQ